MECFTLSLGVQPTEQLNGRRLRCGSESKHGHVGLFAVSADLVCNHIFHIGGFLLTGTKRLCDRCHVLTCGGGMCLIDNNRKTLVFQPCNAIHDIREFLDCGGDDFCIAVQCNGKVGGVAFIVHHTDKSGFVLHAHNGLLKLTVNDNTVGDDDDIIKNNFVICIVQRSEAVCQPCDGVCFAGACAVLYQIILRRAVFTHIRQQLANHIELMIPREYDILGLFRFSCQLVLTFLGFDKDELTDEVKDGILCQNILPHIGDTVFVLGGGVACTGIDAFAVAHVEGQEEGGVACELGGHINLL